MIKFLITAEPNQLHITSSDCVKFKLSAQQTVISTAPEAIAPAAISAKEEEINLYEDLQEIPQETKEMSSQGSIQGIVDSSGDFDDEVQNDAQSSTDAGPEKEDELSDAETTSQSTIKASPSMTTMDSVDVSGSYDPESNNVNAPSDRFRIDL